MPQNDLSVLILKPTENFLEFLASQLPDIYLPTLSKIKHDSTAYSIPKCEDDESILNTVEMFYPLMLKHESSRLVGKHLSNEISGSFFDFLCCFKFELHTEVMSVNATIEGEEHVLCIHPRSVVVSIASENITKAEDTEDLSYISNFTENTTALVQNFHDVSEIRPFMRNHYRPIIKQEMQRLSEYAQYCPVVSSFKLFSRYFDIEFHAHVIHLH